MKYTGQFKTIKNNLIEINIITNNSTADTTELIFSGDSPVVITQESPDGIFSPIKSRSCTITLVSKDEYYDMYSSTSKGTSVEVINKTMDNDCLFFGYLTPCQYNQPYNYLNEIELEAVDAVSVLKDFKFSYLNGSDAQLLLVKDIVKRLINNIAAYDGNIYIPDERLKMNVERNSGATLYERISEEAFMGDDDPLTCYEVLEEICNLHNLSLVPYGRNVYFLDYELIAKAGTTSTDALNNLKYYNINSNGYITISNTVRSLVKNDYAGEENNIEMDEVYNKIAIEADTKEVSDEDLMCDPMDEASSTTYYTTVTSDLQRSDGELWKSTTRFFEFIHGSYGQWIDDDTKWQTLCNVNTTFSGMQYRLTDNFTNRQISQANGVIEFPYRTGYIFNNRFPGQTALPAQQFNYQASKDMPYSSSWDNQIMFFPNAEWLDEYFRANPLTWSSTYGTSTYWWNDFYNNHMGGTYPVLIYRGEKDICFSPTSSSKTNYLAFTGDLLFQRNDTLDDVNYHLWTADTANHYYEGTLFKIKDAGAHDTRTWASRDTSETKYNQGWDMLKVKLKIGNKYWNGNAWTTTESTFWIPYHKDNVVTEDEELIWHDWNKPVTNHDYTYKIGKDAFAIPINVWDYLYGRISIDIYMPRIPWTDGVLYEVNGNTRLNYELTPPVIFMKNLSFELRSSDNDHEHWYLDFSDVDKEEDEIIYENDINTNNVSEFDDLKFKVNTYNDKCPISQSYLVGYYNVYYTDGWYRSYTGTSKRQELNVIDRYIDHYSSPHVIYNCAVHGYIEPWKCVRPTALNNIRMIVDEQEYDVKGDVNNVRLVQYGLPDEDPDPEPTQEYLKFTVTSGTVSFGFHSDYSTLIISTDNGSTWSVFTDNSTITLNEGDSVMAKGNFTTVVDETEHSYLFSINQFHITGSGSVSVEGNMMSLLYGDDFSDKRSLSNFKAAFAGLFEDCTAITDVENLLLPATTLSENCYCGLFEGCSRLINSPRLPALQMQRLCYVAMFSSCTSLTTPPDLPSTNLATYCYDAMFFSCTSLTRAPYLPALNLPQGAYLAMFQGCSNLSYVSANFITDITQSPGNQTERWLKDVAETGTFIYNPERLWNVTGINGIPTGWTAIPSPSPTPPPTPTPSDNPVIPVNFIIYNSLQSPVTIDGDISIVLQNPDHNGHYFGGNTSSYIITTSPKIHLSDTRITIPAGDYLTFYDVRWSDSRYSCGLGETSPFDPSTVESVTGHARNVQVYYNGNETVYTCNNLSSSIVFTQGISYQIVISGGTAPTPPTPTPSGDLGDYLYSVGLVSDNHICVDNDREPDEDNWWDEADFTACMDIFKNDSSVKFIASCGDMIESRSPKNGTGGAKGHGSPEEDTEKFIDLYDVNYWQIAGLRFFAPLGNHDFYGIFESRYGDTITGKKNSETTFGYNATVASRIGELALTGQQVNAIPNNGRDRIVFELESGKSSAVGQADMRFFSYNDYVDMYCRGGGYTGDSVWDASKGGISDDAISCAKSYLNNNWAVFKDELTMWNDGGGHGRNGYSKLNYWLKKDDDIYIFLSVDYGDDVWGLDNNWHDRMIHARTIIDTSSNDPYIRRMVEYVQGTGYSAADSSYNYQYYSPNTLIWLKEILENNVGKKIYIFSHHFITHKVGNSGGIPSNGDWSYEDVSPDGDLTSAGINKGSNALTGIEFWFINKLNNLYKNVIWFNGHSHISWDASCNFDNHEYSIVSPSSGTNKTKYSKSSATPTGTSAWCVSLPSLSKPRAIINGQSSRLYNDAEIGIMEVYEYGVKIKGYKVKRDNVYVYNAANPTVEQTIILLDSSSN